MGWLRSKNADWQSFLDLSAQERSLLAASLLLLPMVVMAHRSLGLRRVQYLLNRFLPGRARESCSAPCAMQLAASTSRMVRIAGQRGLCRATCLQQSLFLRWLLARRGIVAELRFGVRKHGSTVEAHAWLEYLGRVLNDHGDVGVRFVPFPARLSARPMGGT
jgi:hypothetical protein